MSLIPADSIGGRALVVVISIMTFLVCLTAGAATLVVEDSHRWKESVSNEITIQVKARSGEDTEAVVKKAVEIAGRTPGIAVARALSQSESSRILEPWLGQDLDLTQLPVPRLIVVSVNAAQPPDLQALREALASNAPRASLDDHHLWISRLNALSQMIVLFAVGLLALMVVAMSTAIGFATRGAMAGNREIIAVLHFVGAADGFIARQFQSHFARLGSRGAAIGGCVATLFFALPALFSYGSRNSFGFDGFDALSNELTLGAVGYGLIAISCLVIATLTGLISRAIVFNYLNRVF
jgi:cell division transport system permease protein